MPGPKAWDRRYYRKGRTHGMEVLLIAKCPPRGVWTVLTPQLTVTTMNISAASAVSTTPKAGVRYEPMPVLTKGQKDSAKVASDSTIAAGVHAAALGPYVPRGSFLGFLGATAATKVLTGFLGRPVRSVRRFVLVLGLLGILYVGLVAAGLVDALGMFTLGVYNWGIITWEAYWEGYESVVTFTSAVANIAQRYQIGVREAGLLTASLLLIGVGTRCCSALGGDFSDSDEGSGASTPDSTVVSPTPMAVPTEATTALLASATAALQEMSQRQGRFEEKVLALLSRDRPSRAAGPSSPRESSPAMRAEEPVNREYDPGDLQRLHRRLDAFEQILRDGASGRAGVPGSGQGKRTEHDPRSVPVMSVLPGLAGDSPAPPAAGSPDSDKAAYSVAGIVKRLESSARNINAAFLEELKHYKDIPLSEWPLPVGYQQRLAPAYFAEVYRSGNTGENYAREFRRQHGLNDCLAAQEIDNILANFDRMLLIDNEPGFINRVSTEYAARRAFGLQQAFRRCTKKDDWCKPKNAPASWKSKVDWEELDRLDPRASEALPASFRAVENEMRTELERDALLLKAKNKLKEATGSEVSDRLNP